MKSRTLQVIPKSKTAYILLVAAVVLFFTVCGYHVALAQEAGILSNIKRGEKLPPMQLPSLKDMSPQFFVPGGGKPSVIMFFSVRPDFRKQRSLALLSALSDLSEQYKTKLDIVAIYSDSQVADIMKEYMDKSASKVKIYYDSQKNIYNKYGVFMMPLIVLGDENGMLHEVIPYTFDIKKIVDNNVRFLLGEWDKDQLTNSLKPKETIIKSEEEKEYIRRINYGKIMHAKKMYGQAIREFSTAVKLIPHLIDAHIGLGFALLATEKYDKAEISFKDALKINGESDDAISGLGLLYYERGEIDSALPELEKAFIAPNPRLEVIIALADIYEKKGLNEKANRLNKLAVSILMTMYEERWK
ncbi:MAG: hypothetical protein C4538_05320 [Nitrospiraceae bacterium]|nr:MAG: hypothetical protein C4538_05320 [Nitrospiraceae bacterium]